MEYLDWLDRQLAGTEVRNRIGQPVALRAYLHVAADHGLLLSVLTRALESASKWMGAPLSRVYAQGGAALGYLSVHAEFSGGQTALLTSETLREEAPMITLLLIGHHGTMRFDDRPRPVTAARGAAHIQSTIEKSLSSGKPAAVPHAG